MGGFVIEIDDPRRDDVRQLLEQHRTFASGVMPPKGVHVLDGDNAGDDTLTFFSLRVDGELLGIAALRQLDADHAELKSMHTAPRLEDAASGVRWSTTSSPSPPPAACAASASNADRARRSCPRARCTPQPDSSRAAPSAGMQPRPRTCS